MANVMRLCAIFICWADWDWLDHSVENISPLVDGIIIVASEKSNYGEVSPIPDKWKLKVAVCEPVLHYPAHEETRKRNSGLDLARDLLYTHFIMMDADEIYDSKEFLREKQRFIDNPNLAGLVCRTQVFVKSPTLTIGYDTTLVPFIQKITPDLRHEFNQKFPYAWTDTDGVPFTKKRRIRIDPTRSTSAMSGIEWSDITMFHYSWVRTDYARKIRNSTARPNIEKMNLAQKFPHLKEGSIFDLYPGKPLVRVPNKFDLPEFDVVQNLQRDSKPVETSGSAGQ